MKNEDPRAPGEPKNVEPFSDIVREVKETLIGTDAEAPEADEARLGMEENDHLTRPGDEKFDRDEVAEAEKALGQG
jgi:hypothetical protein